MKHLNKITANFVNKATNEERIESVKKFKWIGYTDAIDVMQKLENLITYPKSHRMPNLLLVGDSNNGKTAILTRFDKKNEAYLSETDVNVVCPCLYIQAPPEPDEKRFYNAILEKLFAPYRTSEKIDNRQRRVINLLKDLKVRILIIDEIHHVLAGSPSKQRLFLNVIKYLSNELKIPLVCAGTRLAFNAIQSDQQLANRFEPKVLPRWTNDSEFKRLLLSFERLLPLKKESLLIENSMSGKILSLGDGLIGEVSKILELSTIKAIENGSEKITMSLLQKIDYISPRNRKKMHF